MIASKQEPGLFFLKMKTNVRWEQTRVTVQAFRDVWSPVSTLTVSILAPALKDTCWEVMVSLARVSQQYSHYFKTSCWYIKVWSGAR